LGAEPHLRRGKKKHKKRTVLERQRNSPATQEKRPRPSEGMLEILPRGRKLIERGRLAGGAEGNLGAPRSKTRGGEPDKKPQPKNMPPMSKTKVRDMVQRGALLGGGGAQHKKKSQRILGMRGG